MNRLQKLHESVCLKEDWKKIYDGNFFIKLFNYKNNTTLWCKRDRISDFKVLYMCGINSELKKTFNNQTAAINWIEEQKWIYNESITLPIEKGDVILGGKFRNKRIVVDEITENERGEPLINGRPILSVRLTKKESFNSVDDETTDFFNVYEELSSLNQQIKNYMKKFNIGTNIEEPNKKETKSILTTLRDFLNADFEPEGGVKDLQKNIKNEVQEYKDGEPNITDAHIEMIARTELANMREVKKVLDWKEQGFKKVQWIAHLDEKTGKDHREMNGKIFNIDEVIKNYAEDGEIKIPNRPNCRCTWSIIE